MAITDANLCLGRILPEYFPKIFGDSEDQPLDKAGSSAAFDKLTEEINEFNAGVKAGIYILAITGLKGKNFEGVTGEKEKREKKKRKEGGRRGNCSKTEGKYSYFVSMFNTGP